MQSRAKTTVMLSQNVSVEVFATNLTNISEAACLKDTLLQHYPEWNIHFDLDDCDHILRIEGADIDSGEVIRLSKHKGYQVSALPD
ncbi:hypothetical protein SAMN04488029_1446 [Reichenbachiella faecimaris]|uniref:HMA domain-containing protein n=1 Tax=Reichenbachiella faecimaris TaxID=692418 RepID=A0A1W2G911_REIFA|nr:hypothetical protein [Reichenbachiella faecimaris]SMD33081.1 hypothetical protein SAMN04488029_1446 [Reichenbachiella faecimaris]